MNSPDPGVPRLPRRAVLQWFAAATSALALPAAATGESSAPSPAAKGYGTDPDLARFYEPGAFWPLTFTPAQKQAAAAFADTLFPADHLGPAASELRVPDYLDEWISAPYDLQQKDRRQILAGLQWLDDEAGKRFKAGFAAISVAQRHAICDDICLPAEAGTAFKSAAAFFVKFRALAASAYYATPAGWQALGYVGNITTATFDGPPPEVLAKLGVEQTVN